MARRLRVFDPEKMYFLTNTTEQATFFMTPNDRVTEEIGAVIGRGQSLHPIQLFGYVVMSNHLHLMVKGDPDKIVAFARYIFGNIARRVSRLINHTGRFWAGRYRHTIIADDDAARERLSYVLAHGVKEGLVDRAEQWPGLHCIEHLKSESDRVFGWKDCHGEAHEETLKLSRLPFWIGMSSAQHRRELNQTIKHSVERAAVARGNKPPLGVARVLAANPFAKSEERVRTPQPLCHASNAESAARYIAEFREFSAAYRVLSARFRKGDQVEFPFGSFPPPLMECSRRVTSVAF